MVCRLGLIFLGVRPPTYILSWATLFPNTVVFPQISQRIFFIAFALAKASFHRELRLVLRSKIAAIAYGSKSRKTAKIENSFSIFCPPFSFGKTTEDALFSRISGEVRFRKEQDGTEARMRKVSALS